MTPDEIRDQLRQFICRDLMRNAEYPLANDEPMITGGLIDSFALAHIGVFIEMRFGVYIPDAELTVDNMDTLDQVAQRVMAG